MDKNEARLWAVTLMEAQQGNEESKQTLAARNQLRQEQGLPTIEQELQKMHEAGEL